MKEGWVEKTLPEISENLDSMRIPITKKNRAEGIYPYYGASGIVDYVNDYIFDEDLLCISEDGANLLMRTYPIAFPITGKVWVNNHAHVLRFKSMVTQKYVEYYFAGLKLDDYITGAAQPKLTQKALNKINIHIPSTITEQQEIVSYLDSAFAKIDALKKNAEKKLKELPYLYNKEINKIMKPREMWEKKRFGEVCIYKKEQGIYKNIPYIGMEHIESSTGHIIGHGNSNDIKSSSFKFEKGDVLYGRLRPYLRKVYVAEFNGCCSTEVFPIRSKEVEPGFIKYWFLMDETSNKINDSSAGCRMPRGNMNEVKNYTFCYPKERTEQRKIISQLDDISDQIHKLENIMRKTIAECEALKQALLRQVFE